MVKDEKIRQMGVKEGQSLRTGTGGRGRRRRRRVGLDWSHVTQQRLQTLSGLCLLLKGRAPSPCTVLYGRCVL